jgi:class 3 adenylate cyclase
MCTVRTDEISTERKLVVVFDICSSTTILEELKQNDCLGHWRNFLISVKDYIESEGELLGVDLYKFQGDGWILLFPPEIRLAEIGDFLGTLSTYFDSQFDYGMLPLLQKKPRPFGLTFGIDSGDLVRIRMSGQEEYMGRAINLAARLQGATKTLSDDYGYTALFSKHSFNSMNTTGPKGDFSINVKPVKVPLKNIIAGSEYESLCWRIL